MQIRVNLKVINDRQTDKIFNVAGHQKYIVIYAYKFQNSKAGTTLWINDIIIYSLKTTYGE